MKHSSVTPERGFTLVEVLVSIAIFAIVMTIALGGLLSAAGQSKRGTRQEAVVDALSFSIDSIKHDLALGSFYHCNGSDIADFSVPPTARDCPTTPASSFAFQDTTGQTTVYFLNTADHIL